MKTKSKTQEPSIVLSAHSLLEHISAVVMVDKVAIYNIYWQSLDIEHATYTNLNWPQMN